MISFWIIEIFISIGLGYEIMILLASHMWNALVCFGSGISVGILIYTWIFIIISLFQPLKLIHGKMVSIILLFISIFLHFANKKSKLLMIIRMDYFHCWTFIFIGFLLTIFYYFSMLMDGMSSKGAAYSDLPFHLNLISSFSYGKNYQRKSLFDFSTPFFSNESLAYPIIADFFSASLVVTGSATFQESLFLPSLLMSFSILIAIFYLSQYYTSSNIGASISTILFFGLGGIGFIILFDPSARKDLTRCDFVHIWNDGIEEFWFQTLVHLIVPQRSSLFAIPLCYWSIFALILGVQKNDIKMMFVAGLMTGFTPQVQAHAYISMAQWSIAFFIITFPYRLLSTRKIQKNEYEPYKYSLKQFILLWFVYAITANIMAFPQLFPYFSRLKSGKKYFLKFNPIWNTPQRRNDKYAPFVLWWRGLGVFGLISLVFGWFTASQNQIKVYIPSIFVWLIGNLVRYQVWEMDNIKIFYDGWIPIAAPFVSQYILFFIKQGKKRRRPILHNLIAFLIITLSIFSAIVCIMRVLILPTQIFDENDIEFGNWIAENTNTNDIFLTSTTTNQPVAAIGGRELFLGYLGWVLSHGIEYSNRISIFNYLIQNPNDIEKFKEYKITYVVDEKKELIFNCNLDSDFWEIIYSDDKRRVWRRTK